MINKVLIITLLGFIAFMGCEEQNANSEAQPNEEMIEETVVAIPVEAMLIKERIIEQKFPLTGILAPNNSVDIVAEVGGKVTSIKKEVGDYISANQTLAIVDDVIPESQYKQAQAQVLSAKSSMDITKSNLKSDKILLENGDISELEYNSSQSNFNNTEAQYLSAQAALSAAKKSFEDTRIKSPISGIVARKNIEFGTMASIGTPVYRVVDLSKLKLNVSVPQEVINRVTVGGKAVVYISALNGNHFEGFVKRISPQADEMTGGFMIEILVPNKENKIKAGMTAKIELLLSKNDKVLAIPEYALVTKESESYVYKVNSDFAELVKIDLGETIGENIVVVNGLSENDKVVTVGMKNLGLKTKVRVEKLY